MNFAGGLNDPRPSVRVAALSRISAKKGRRRIERLSEDQRLVPLLTTALSDPDSRVRRAAARGLRPWVREEPRLLDEVLPLYAGHSFDGSYSHLGLLDTRSRDIWIPRFAALKGHAALMADGNTDSFFKFELYVPHQAPAILRPGGGSEDGHLVLNLFAEWSYSRQRTLGGLDQRLLVANVAEQARYSGLVIAFYRELALSYAIRVHEASGARGLRRYVRDVALLPARG